MFNCRLLTVCTTIVATMSTGGFFSLSKPSTFHDIKPWLTFVERHEPSITLCVATDAPMHELSGANNSADISSADNEYIEDYDDWCLGNGFEYIDLQEQPEDMTQGTE